MGHPFISVLRMTLRRFSPPSPLHGKGSPHSSLLAYFRTDIPISQYRLDRLRNRRVASAIYVWGLLGSELKAIWRNRRVSATLSPILSLFLAPSGKLYQKVQQLLAEDEKASGSPPSIIPHRRPGPKHPRYGIPAEQWLTVLQRVLENKEPLRKVADEYGVSHETIRRLIRTASRKRTG